MDTRTQRNLDLLNEQLNDVERIMKSNLHEVLGRGEALSSLTSRTETLRSDSLRYKKQAKYLNYQLWMRKYLPVAILVLMIIFVVYFRFFW